MLAGIVRLTSRDLSGVIVICLKLSAITAGLVEHDPASLTDRLRDTGVRAPIWRKLGNATYRVRFIATMCVMACLQVEVFWLFISGLPAGGAQVVPAAVVRGIEC